MRCRVRFLVMLFMVLFRMRCFLLRSFRRGRRFFRLRFTTTGSVTFGFGVR
jgi:hypothetical protein